MTITCPRCGLDFESRATTATRCPTCRTVVHISRGTSSARGRSARSSVPARSVSHISLGEEPDGTGPHDLIVLAAVVAAGYLTYRLVRRWWGRRGLRAEDARTLPGEPSARAVVRATTSPTFAHDGPEAEPGPCHAIAENDATRANTGTNGDEAQPAA
jgi:hypothetical protein